MSNTLTGVHRRLLASLAAIAMISAVILPNASFGQAVTSGTIEIRVADSSGAALPGATVTLTNAERGVLRTGVSDERGVFQFLLVPVANNYELRAELSGFGAAVISGIRVDPGTQVRNAALSVGGLEETVTVAGSAPLIDTSSGSITHVMDATLMEEVPLATRNFAEVASLFPGVHQTAADNSATFTQFHVRGQATTGHGYRIDGADQMTPYLGRTGSTLSPLAIDRMEFISGGMPAEYGEQPGGIFNIISKSGTNSRRSAYAGQTRPDALNSKVVSGITGQVVDSAKGNSNLQEFAQGGPLVRNKLFYFGNYQFRQSDNGNILSNSISTGMYHNVHLKLTHVQNANNSLNFVGDFNTVAQHNTNLLSTVTAEAQGGQMVKIGTFNVSQTHQFTPTMVLETQVLFYGLKQTSPVEQPTGRPNVTTVSPGGTLTTGQNATFSGWTDGRWKGTAKVTKLARSHTFKAGMDYSYVTGERFNEQQVPIYNDRRPVGGVLTRTQNFYTTPYPLDDRWFDVFAQDTWPIVDNLTLQYGLRADYQRIAGEFIAQPRVGLSWDVVGDGANKVSASWGRIHQVIPGTQYSVESTYLQEQYRVDAPLGAFVGPEVLTNRFRTVRVGAFKNPITKTGTLGYDRLLPFDSRLSATYVWSDFADRQIGTRYADRVEYTSGGRNRYRGLELTFQKYMTHHFQVMASYTRSKTEGDTETVLTVNQQPYRYALVDWHSPHASTVSAVVELPYGLSVAPVLKFISGRPYSIDNAQVGTLVTYIDREGNPAGRNIYQMPNITSLSFAIGRDFRAGGVSFKPQLEILNATNHLNIIAVQSAFVSAGRPTRVDNGRQIQFGFDVRF